MTLTAVKLVRVQIFASIGKAVTMKIGNNENLHPRPPNRPPDRPPATMIAIPLWAFSPRGKNQDFGKFKPF